MRKIRGVTFAEDSRSSEALNGSQLIRAVDTVHQVPILLRCSPPATTAEIEVRRLENELAMTTHLNLESVIRGTQLEYFPDVTVLFLEGFEGKPLDQIANDLKNEVIFLKVAILITDALQDIHKTGTIHKDIKPQNIWVNASYTKVKLTGFGLATRVPLSYIPVQTIGFIEGTLAYMSPEQTGRMNRALDYRTDFYSLGVTFYYCLTGMLPFEASDPMEWFHCQIARKPRPIRDYNPDIPETISKIVLKLLSKSAEDRYQTEAGLKKDLQTCLSQLESDQRIQPFSLGTQDYAGHFELPDRLYGREKETFDLLDAYEKSLYSGKRCSVFISGHAGIGKSALVQELPRSIVQDRALFLSGKFDPLKKGIPYYTIGQAFRDALQQILSQSEEEIESWRGDFHRALGNNAQLICEIIPELNLILGDQPSVIELPPSDAKNRLNNLFLLFLRVFNKKGFPIVLFLDDLQWVDSASLSLIQNILIQSNLEKVFFIGAFRDNEVSSSHPLVELIKKLSDTNSLLQIFLGPLKENELFQFLQDIFHKKVVHPNSFSELIYKKTGGNPFFVIQFLRSLYQEKLIIFNFQKDQWEWQVEQIESKGYSDNVIDFMIERLKKLPVHVQETIQLAACIGNKGTLKTLSTIQNIPEEESSYRLYPAVHEGLLSIRKGDYRFTHDRVQQAAYLLVSDHKKKRVHSKIGKIILNSVPEKDREGSIFEIVNQLNRGILRKCESNFELAQLNLIAGRKAKRATAYRSAVRYFGKGVSLLPPDSWTLAYHLTHSLYFELAESEYLTGNFEEAEQIFEGFISQVKTKIERANIVRAEIDLLTLHNQPQKATARGISGLKELGVEISLEATHIDVVKEIEEIYSLLGHRSIEDLIDIPNMENSEMQAAMSMLASFAPFSGSKNMNLSYMCFCKMVRLSLIYGHSPSSPMAYTHFATVLSQTLENHIDAYRFGRLGYSLVESRQIKALRGRTMIAYGGFISYLKEPLSIGLAELQKAYPISIEEGDYIYASYCGYLIGSEKLALGQHLIDVQEELEKQIDFSSRVNNVPMVKNLIAIERLVQNLRGQTDQSNTYSSHNFNETEFEKAVVKYERVVMKFVYFVRKLQARYIFGDLDEAIQISCYSEEFFQLGLFSLINIEYFYFHALYNAATFDRETGVSQEDKLKRLFEYQKKLKIYSETCPENFLDKYALVSAEIARVTKKSTAETLSLYDFAIRVARENSFVQNEAIANELAGKYCLSVGMTSLGRLCIQKARDCYLRWGANGKVNQLARQYSFLTDIKPSVIDTIAAPPERLDLMTVIKASHDISRQMVLNDLFESLIRIIIEAVGADRGYFLVDSLHGLKVESEGISSHELEVRSVPSIPVSEFSEIPISVVNYVMRTRQRLILDDPFHKRWFASDGVIARRRPKSVLCIPIVRKSRLIGIFYLENEKMLGAFTESRLRVIEPLLSQAAISVENAQLYSNLQKSEKQIRAIVDHATAAIYLKDLEGRYLMVNRQFENLVQMPSQEIQGMTDFDLLGKDKAEIFALEDQEVVLSRRPLEKERVLFRENSNESYLSVKFPLFDEWGEVYAIGGIATDISDRIRVEEERSKRLAEAQESLRIRDEFIAIASHELRTPLTPIRLHFEIIHQILRKERLGKIASPEELANAQKIEKMMNIAQQQIERLSSLINDLLDVSRISTGQLSLNKRKENLSAIVQNLVERFSSSAEKAKCPLSVSLPQNLFVQLDTLRIEQVIVNLLSNAFKYGAGRPVELKVWTEGKFAKLSVRDSGIGIAQKDMSRIFERFERAVSLKTFGGLGLGLYISKKIVLAHVGEIDIQSEPGQGSVFTVSLPIEPIDE